MDNIMELHQIIYSLFASQIEFGTYRYGDSLPKMEDAGRWLSVSLDTVRTAYLRLKKDGYITLTKKAGAAVAIRFEESEIEGNIQTFFSLRRAAVLDLCQSLGPLFSRAQWLALKNADSDTLDELECLSIRSGLLPPYIMVQHVWLIYGTLNNNLLLRLVWQAFLFYQAPFLSLPVNSAAFDHSSLLNMIGQCRRKDWSGLWQTVESFQEQLTSGIRQFYAERIVTEATEEPVVFRWNAYENSSQRCYTLAMDLLDDIRLNRFEPGGLLPSPAKIATEKQISIITVRRTLALLNHLGATRSMNGVGTQVLSTEGSAENCDFEQPVIRKRLLDFAQSLHILALTCGACMQCVFYAMDASAIQEWKARLAALKESSHFESVVYETLEVIPRYSPVQAVREVYSQLLQILIWGYPLRGLHGSREQINEFYLPYIVSLSERLERNDGAGLASELEGLMAHELRFAAARLDELGIAEAGAYPPLA